MEEFIAMCMMNISACIIEISREGDIAEEEPVKGTPVPLTARHQIFAELQQTEKNYCDTLVTLIKVLSLIIL